MKRRTERALGIELVPERGEPIGERIEGMDLVTPMIVLFAPMRTGVERPHFLPKARKISARIRQIGRIGAYLAGVPTVRRAHKARVLFHESYLAIYTSDLKTNPGCAGATHFVWAYNLGAFELASAANTSGQVEASSIAGGAGAKKSHEEKAVSSGGKLASCETQDQRACRVPIRLALHGVSPGDNPITATPGAAPKGDSATVPGVGSPEAQGEALMKEAHDKYEHGDGQGALDLANKAMGLDSRLRSDSKWKEFRAEAVMLSGRCEDGKRDYRAVLAEQDRKHGRDRPWAGPRGGPESQRDLHRSHRGLAAGLHRARPSRDQSRRGRQGRPTVQGARGGRDGAYAKARHEHQEPQLGPRPARP